MAGGSLTILGCGPSRGLPTAGGYWGECDPTEPRNARTRTCALFSYDERNFLIDAGPDLRQQFLREKITRVDGVFLTHAHSDHTAGLAELASVLQTKPMPIYIPSHSQDEILNRFSYVFDQGPPYFYGFAKALPFDAPVVLDPFWAAPFEQDHRYVLSSGLRFPGWAYSTDVCDFSEETLLWLRGIDLWVLDCLNPCPRKKPKTHANGAQVKRWIDIVRPQRVVLTHMGFRMDYQTWKNEFGSNVELAYDGLKIDLPALGAAIPAAAPPKARLSCNADS